jgi:hypothetical protein
MDTWVIVTLVVIAVLALAAIAAYWYMEKQRRSEELQRRFGPEYEREVDAKGRSQAERELNGRAERVQKLHIRDLDPGERQRYSEQWRSVQAHFVDEPTEAIGDADRLCQEVMDKRGYPVGDFEQQAADISVDHPEVVSNYRQAHAIAQQHDRDGATTEELRQAMVHYRALFSELLGEVAAGR